MRLFRTFLALTLILGVCKGALACVICAQEGGGLTTVQMLQSASDVLLAAPNPDQKTFRVVSKLVTRGKHSVPDVIDTGSVSAGNYSPPAGKLRLFFRANPQATWENMGWISPLNRPWLTKLLKMPVPSALTTHERQLAWARYFAPMLENSDPVLAQAAFEEVSRTPFGVMRQLSDQWRQMPIRQWLVDPARHSRRTLHYLLFGFVAKPLDLADLQASIINRDRIRIKGERAAMVAAYLEVAGPGGLNWVTRQLMLDEKNSDTTLAPAVLALSVHGNDGQRITRAQVMGIYRQVLDQRPLIAGALAPELVAWQEWGFADEFASILEKHPTMPFGMRYPLILYLHRNPTQAAKLALEGLQRAGKL